MRSVVATVQRAAATGTSPLFVRDSTALQLSVEWSITMSVATPSTSVPRLAAGAHDAPSQAALSARRKAFRALHERGCFVIPNPWDVGSARYLQHLGFPALATTSAGFAFSQGLPDSGGDGIISRDRTPRGDSQSRLYSITRCVRGCSPN
jgi:hypothetical protein